MDTEEQRGACVYVVLEIVVGWIKVKKKMLSKIGRNCITK